MSKHKNCQSCGMPLSRDSEKGGTEKNGEKSTAYCSHCYVKGEFVQPDLSLQEMKQLVEGKIKDSGFPKFLAAFFTRNLHKLERWKS
ncbi:zinc ribbon domain-containing protein [Peribacillus deserti]|uniref:Putative zinc ribbon domain-containing protein n=1 Tax=Peribacillus deserti TaxID=673318 RepID=A0A2N5M1F0_9BACI|nr:zinc ribbon domain-containing protein [Peribacillus deserti]PLT28214.1 hypothetical protein CUU66_19930 [Peribacillus deserti]